MIAYILTFLLVAGIHADVSAQLEAAAEPANMDGLMLVQLAVEDGERWMDAYPPASCYAAWWALERAALRVLGESLRTFVMGDAETANALSQAASIDRWLALKARDGITC